MSLVGSAVTVLIVVVNIGVWMFGDVLFVMLVNEAPSLNVATMEGPDIPTGIVLN